MVSAEKFAPVAPALFVFLWSTGFIGAKYCLPYGEPMTVLALRFAVVAGLLGGLALLARVELPRDPKMWMHLVVIGVLIQSCYLGGGFYAMWRGLDAGLTALIVGVQPLLTAVLVGPLLGERLTRRQYGGFVLGFAGLMMVLARTAPGTLAPDAIAGCVLAVVGITLGTLYQKRFVVGVDIRAGSMIQFAAACIPCLALAMAFETREIEWNLQFTLGFAWLCVVMSVGAISIPWFLIQRGAASRVASLFYLVPSATAVEGYILFGEVLGPVQIVGIAVTAAGVAMVNPQESS